MSLHGLLLIDKPAGVTSFRVMHEVQRRLSCKRGGHAGTLDPAATGLLVVLLGECTKLSDWVMAEDKVYEAEVLFGRSTDTLDRDGVTTEEVAIPPGGLTEASVRAACHSLVGAVEQVPPVFSAIKRDGRTLMSRARAGEEVTPEPRNVVCHGLDVLDVTSDRARMRVHCGKGYYVRSMARDLGQALGLPAHLSALRRLAVGDWSVEGAVLPDSANPEDVIPIPHAIPGLPAVSLTAEHLVAVQHGRQVPTSEDATRAILTDPDGVAVAMAVQDVPGFWRVQRGFRYGG